MIFWHRRSLSTNRETGKRRTYKHTNIQTHTHKDTRRNTKSGVFPRNRQYETMGTCNNHNIKNNDKNHNNQHRVDEPKVSSSSSSSSSHNKTKMLEMTFLDGEATINERNGNGSGSRGDKHNYTKVNMDHDDDHHHHTQEDDCYDEDYEQDDIQQQRVVVPSAPSMDASSSFFKKLCKCMPMVVFLIGLVFYIYMNYDGTDASSLLHPHWPSSSSSSSLSSHHSSSSSSTHLVGTSQIGGRDEFTVDEIEQMKVQLTPKELVLLDMNDDDDDDMWSDNSPGATVVGGKILAPHQFLHLHHMKTGGTCTSFYSFFLSLIVYMWWLWFSCMKRIRFWLWFSRMFLFLCVFCLCPLFVVVEADESLGF